MTIVDNSRTAASLVATRGFSRSSGGRPVGRPSDDTCSSSEAERPSPYEARSAESYERSAATRVCFTMRCMKAQTIRRQCGACRRPEPVDRSMAAQQPPQQPPQPPAGRPPVRDKIGAGRGGRGGGPPAGGAPAARPADSRRGQLASPTSPKRSTVRTSRSTRRSRSSSRTLGLHARSGQDEEHRQGSDRASRRACTSRWSPIPTSRSSARSCGRSPREITKRAQGSAAGLAAEVLAQNPGKPVILATAVINAALNDLAQVHSAADDAGRSSARQGDERRRRRPTARCARASTPRTPSW